MSLLEMLRNVANEIGTGNEPQTVVGSSDKQTKELLACAHRIGHILTFGDWQELHRTHSFTLTDSVSSYQLPVDFDGLIPDSEFDESNLRPLWGPVSDAQWQENTIISSSTPLEREYRIAGYGLKQFQVNPTPSSSDAGQTLSFRYYSKNWVRPASWTASTDVTAGSYCFYDGVYFYTGSAGTTGTTAPTTSVPNDGGIVWTVITSVYDKFLADTDTVHWDEKFFELGILARFMSYRKLPGWEDYAQEFKSQSRMVMAKMRGASMLSLVPARGGPIFSPTIPLVLG